MSGSIFGRQGILIVGNSPEQVAQAVAEVVEMMIFGPQKSSKVLRCEPDEGRNVRWWQRFQQGGDFVDYDIEDEVEAIALAALWILRESKGLPVPTDAHSIPAWMEFAESLVDEFSSEGERIREAPDHPTEVVFAFLEFAAELPLDEVVVPEAPAE
jgi:hypothetical protein